jgi:hypothetical protein
MRPFASRAKDSMASGKDSSSEMMSQLEIAAGKGIYQNLSAPMRQDRNPTAARMQQRSRREYDHQNCYAVSPFDGEGARLNVRHSCRTTLRSELSIRRPPLYLIKPSFRNLFMKKLTRERVVPTISASIS